MTDISYLMKVAERTAINAGKAIMEIYKSGTLITKSKPGEFPLTEADKKSHSIIIEGLSETGLPVLSEEGVKPDFNKRKDWEYFWLIDPLDGTKEFINRNDEFTVNIGLVNRDKPVGGVVYAPCTGTVYIGSKETGVYKKEKGKLVMFTPLERRNQFKNLLQQECVDIVASRSHISRETKDFINQFKNSRLLLLGSSLKFMMLLENKALLYPRLEPTMEWDTAAPHAILNASNRGVYQTDLQSELIYNKPDLKNPFFISF